MDDESRAEFSVYGFYADGARAFTRRWLHAKNAVEVAHRCIWLADRFDNFIDRVIITDGGDCTAFEWQRDKGITFK